jgi:drug/metabolite transporter (DMT)-like permease
MTTPQASGNEVKGIILAIAGIGCITFNDAMMKLVIGDIPVAQAIFVRGCFAMLPIALLVSRTGGWRTLVIRNHRAQAWCAVLLAVPLFVFVYSLSQLPLSLATIIFFTNPLFVLLLAPRFLGEQLSRTRVIAVLTGFVGALMVMQPTASAFNWIMLGPVLVALLTGVRELVLRRVVVEESSGSILFYSSLAVTLCALATWPLGWAQLTGNQVGLLASASLGFGFGLFLMTEALRFAQASFLSPYKYSAVVWALLLGYVLWGEQLNPWAYAGTTLIVASGLYVALQGRRACAR